MVDKSLRFRDFDFAVADDRFEPPPRRDDEVRLLVVNARNESVVHDRLSNLPAYFDSRDVLVWNRAGIGPSRLRGRTESGAPLDICFLMQRDDAEPYTWDAVILSEARPAPTAGAFSLADGAIQGELMGWRQEFDAGYWISRDRYDGYRGEVRISAPTEQLRAVLARSGLLMHPWYTDLNDLPPEQLNPVGSTRPTATLLAEPARRIDRDMREQLKRKGVRSLWPSLYMSFSWRQASPDMRLVDYEMNEEEYEISGEDVAHLRSCLADGCRMTSIGTSGVRVLESLADLRDGHSGRTSLFIAPGFRLRHVHGLLTNLHNPMGTHIIMAAAVGGYDLVMRAYREAVDEGYYFGIHGDSMLVFSGEA